VKKFLRVKNAAVLEISPNIVRTAKVDKDGVPTENYLTDSLNMEFTKLGYVALGEYEFVKWIYALSTDNLKEGELLSRLRTDHRRTTRLSEGRYGLRVRELDVSELGILKDLSNEAAERHGFVTPEISYYKEMKEVYSNLTQYLCVVLSEVLEEYNVKSTIKWPNDIKVNNKKISGILAEAVIEKNELKGLILGFGVNLNYGAHKTIMNLVKDENFIEKL
jgi:lipid II:glycine glycyltransferase (peptidoglycan interpeptide bridge formation enzyme)